VTPEYDDPVEVAEAVMALPAPPLVGFDVDGVLAPIVAHAADAALLPGVLARLIQLAKHVPVAVVSGRAVSDLARFGFPASIMVAGSHGAERRGLPLVPLTPVESTRLSRLRSLAATAADEAGPGAWVEHKPTGVVLHIRESNPERGQAAADRLVGVGRLVAGAQVKQGHGVVELVARPASKATAIRAMWDESGAASVSYVGDDVTDEDVFRSLTPVDLGIRVGPGSTAATRRLADPTAVTEYLRALVDRLG
jgi:trehalose 6-phosphate phosphatase